MLSGVARREAFGLMECSPTVLHFPTASRIVARAARVSDGGRLS
jgi:hypothetical protein